jgi:hypothetical protein
MRDNRQTMHRARRHAPDQVRDMLWSTIAGDGPTVARAELAAAPATAAHRLPSLGLGAHAMAYRGVPLDPLGARPAAPAYPAWGETR